MASSPPASHFTVLTPTEFIQDVTEAVKQARERVWMQAMEIEPGEIADKFLNNLASAGKRRLDTRLHMDWYSLLATDGVFNYWPFVSTKDKNNRKKRLAAKKAFLRELQDAGVQTTLVNPPTILDRLFPARGRNHMKIVIVDDSAWIGGINFHEQNFEALDSMVKLTDPELVDEIAYVFRRIDKKEKLRDMAVQCTDETTLLIDSGMINRSIILAHAVDMVKKAEKSIKVVSPILPDAGFSFALNKARKAGKEITIIAPDIKKMTGIYTQVDQFNEFLMKLRGMNLPITFKDHTIHAKILIIDDHEVLYGSHNLSSRGVRMGTEEIALQSTNKTFVRNVISFYEQIQKFQTQP